MNAKQIVSGFSAYGQAPANRALKEAWQAWENGRIPEAQSLAEARLSDPATENEARQLLCLTHYVSGQFETAIEHYDALPESYGPKKQLAGTILEAYLFLKQVDEALAFARLHPSSESYTTKLLERHAAQPFRATLDEVATIPFADHALTEYFPAFSVTVNGEATTAHVDTGGAFLYMGPDRAAALGIETIETGKGRFHLDLKSRPIAAGIADRFSLGPATFENVPVTVLPTLIGESDFIIFGTRILHEFLSTLDYPNYRLILSPRTDETLKARHRAMLPANGIEVPFYLWADHFMFARGAFGDHRGLNFFVDSGLVIIHADDQGIPQQAAFTTSKRILKKWNIPQSEIRKGHFFIPGDLALGPLAQSGHIIQVGAAGDNNFGGIQIDGLISHAFLKRYAWTIDFDTRTYTFSQP